MVATLPDELTGQQHFLRDPIWCAAEQAGTLRGARAAHTYSITLHGYIINLSNETQVSSQHEQQVIYTVFMFIHEAELAFCFY